MLSPAHNDDNYVITATDDFTRLIQTVPLPAKYAKNIIERLIRKSATIIGPPVTLISDNGTELTSEYFSEV